MDIKEIADESYATAVEKGHFDETSDIIQQLALVHCEVSEAVEYCRLPNLPYQLSYKDEKGKLHGVPTELADIILRTLHIAQHWGINLEDAIKAKMAYNKTRPYKHGKKL